MAGFSLIELMIVLAVLGILLGGAIQLFDSLVRGQKARSASFELYTSLSVARSEALKRGTSVTLTANSAGDWAQGWQVQDGLGNVVTEQGRFDSVTIVPSPASASIQFASTGRPTGSPAFTVSIDGDYQRCVRLELSGMPRTTTGACS